MANDSLREQVVQALVDQLASQREGVPSGAVAGLPNAYDFKWDAVIRYPIGEKEKRSQYALSVIEATETKTPQADSVNAALALELNFRIYLDPKDEPATCLNRALLNIQRRVREDPQLGGLAIDVREDSNTHEVDSFEDRQVVGTVFYTLRYKHAENDPRLQRGLP